MTSTENIFMAVVEAPDEDILAVPLVTSDMKAACRPAERLVLHDMRPTFHPKAMPNWRDCLTCYRCGYTIVTQAMFEQAPLWAKVYLAALYLESWLELLEDLPEEADAGAEN